jgi:hypothetical protein
MWATLSVEPVRLSMQTTRTAGEQEGRVGTDEAGPARHEDPHRPDPQPASTGLRPIGEYSKPSRRMRSGS